MKEQKILIIDVSIFNMKEKFEKFGLTVFNGTDLTRRIIEWDQWNRFDRDTTLLVFPGNGARIVRSYILEEWIRRWNCAQVYTKRYWKSRENPRVVVERIFPDKMILGLKEVIVVDDVVSSGQTCKKLRKKNSPWMPGANWNVVTWVAQRSTSIKGFVLKFAAEEVGFINKKVPINSLSTLLEDREIADIYARKNFENPKSFLQLLEGLRNSLKARFMK